ncbi:hypothetical protein COB64_03880 [Candidatus Wolfebacteria bacterium]|nr:MAG: hypothetical protein COB64_03880 [Candidatus Wolfebacteria bacterium]
MESRSLIKVIQLYSHEDHNGIEKTARNILVNIYTQMDGYIEEHGRYLAEFLKDFRIEEDCHPSEDIKVADGACCLAVQILVHLQKWKGYIYLLPFDVDECGQRYEYYITVDEDIMTIDMKVIDVLHNKSFFEGTPEQFLKKLWTMPRKHNLN